MKRFIFVISLLVLAICGQAQQFQAAEPVCGKQKILMNSNRGNFSLFFSSSKTDQQPVAEIGKDLYILSRNTPFHVLEEPLLRNEVSRFLNVWQDYQRQAIVQNGENEFFIFFTSAAVIRTHLDSQCPAKGSWYALRLDGVTVAGNRVLLKALKEENWQEALKKASLGSLKHYTVVLEPLCADEYGGKNCIFVL